MEKKKTTIGRRILRVFLRTTAVICVLFLSGCGLAALLYQRSLNRGGYLESWDADEGRILTGLSYGEGSANKYDLYLHKSIKPESEAPLLLLVHGGAWMGGKRDDMAYACKYYGKNGCITATMDYSLISEKRPGVTIKTMLDEIAACTAALKKQLETEGYHVSGMAIGGTSAGGHLSMLYAYARGKDSAIPIAFVFEKVGPVSVTKDFWDEKTAAALIGYGAGIQVDPKKLDTPEVIEAGNGLSPLHFVGDGTPPTIFAYGGRDDLVKPVHRDALAKALEEHRIANVRIDFPNSNHALWDDPDCVEQFRKAVLDYCVKYLKLPPAENAVEAATTGEAEPAAEEAMTGKAEPAAEAKATGKAEPAEASVTPAEQ